MSTSIPPVIRAAFVARPPTEAFAVFTEEIGAWWPLSTHGVFGADNDGLLFRDGKLVEIATDGRENIWGEVLHWDPPNRLTITWHPYPQPGESSEVDVVFEGEGEGTRVTLEHRDWEAFGEQAMAKRSVYVGPNAWGSLLDCFAGVADVA